MFINTFTFHQYRLPIIQNRERSEPQSTLFSPAQPQIYKRPCRVTCIPRHLCFRIFYMHGESVHDSACIGTDSPCIVRRGMWQLTSATSRALLAMASTVPLMLPLGDSRMPSVHRPPTCRLIHVIAEVLHLFELLYCKARPLRFAVLLNTTDISSMMPCIR